MKTFYKSLFAVAVAASALVSCQQEIESPIEKNDVKFVLNAKMPETKTGIYYDNGSYAPYWNNGDELGVLFAIPTESGDLSNDAVFANIEEDGEDAAFEGTVSIAEGSGITFYSYYPAAAGMKVYKDNNTEDITFGLDVPSAQSPKYDSTFGYTFDPAADILVAKPATCTVISTTGANEVDMYFTRITSVLRLALNMESSVTGYGDLVSKVTIETSAGDIAGRVVVDLATGIYSKTNNKTNSKTIVATIDPVEVPTVVGAGNNNIFLSVAPVTIPAGSALTFTIETVDASTKADAHKIVKTIASTTNDIVFESAKPTVITLNITEGEVGLADSLSPVDYSGFYAITNVGKTRIMGKYGSGNNISSEAIVANGDDVLYENGITIADCQYTITKQATGTYAGMYTIQDADDKYIYAASSSANQLKSKAEADANCYWTITNTDGHWSIVATKSSNRNVLQNNGNLFACYASASQTAVALVPWANVKVDDRPVITGATTLPLDSDAVTDEALAVSFNAFVTSVSAAAYDDDEKNTTCTWLTPAASGTDVTYSATKNNTGSSRTAYLFVTAENEAGVSTELMITVTQAEEGGTAATTVTDHLTYNLIGISGTNYTTWSDIQSNSYAVYAGKTAGGNSSIQLNATTTNGIYSSTSGGYLKSITVTWNSNTASARKLFVYASDDEHPYTGISTSGTKVVELTPNSASYTFTANYTYISLVGNGGALYMDDIAIEWGSTPIAEKVATPVISCSSNTVTITCATDGAAIYYTTDGSTPSSSSNSYSDPFGIDSTVTVKAIAIKASCDDSDVASQECVYVKPTVATPTFSPVAGAVDANTTVTISCATDGATIYYTTDGSDPTSGSTQGTSVTINAAMTIKAIAIADGYNNSAIATAAYTIVGAAQNLPFSESFESDKGLFSIDNASNPDDLDNIWSHSSTYMKATSYVSSSNHNAESWLISPWIQLPTLETGESIKLKFEQCINKYFGTIADEATLWVKSYGGSWSKITITYPSLNGNWSAFEEQVVDLSTYANSKIQFAFKYVGTSTTAGTWEVKNVSVRKYDPIALSSISVSGQKTSFTVGDTFSFGGTVTAHYNDESTADVTASATFTGYNMSTAGEQTVTVSYTDGTTKTTTYGITVTESGGDDVIVLSEDFSAITSGNSTSTSGSSTAWNGNTNFPTVTRAYQAGGAIKIGASGNPGSITSKSLDLSNSFTVSIDVKGWTSVEGNITVTVGSTSKTITYTETMSSGFGTYTVDFNAATASSTVIIATSAKRAFIDNVIITRHD